MKEFENFIFEGKHIDLKEFYKTNISSNSNENQFLNEFGLIKRNAVKVQILLGSNKEKPSGSDCTINLNKQIMKENMFRPQNKSSQRAYKELSHLEFNNTIHELHNELMTM